MSGVVCRPCDCAQVKGVTDCGLKAREVRVVAVLGGGLMGSGIATACLLAGQEVLLKEINQKFLEVRARRNR
jgi:enoyl-CoA hydratase/3-hydroxyacyl-CoA dehydrogenase